MGWPVESTGFVCGVTKKGVNKRESKPIVTLISCLSGEKASVCVYMSMLASAGVRRAHPTGVGWHPLTHAPQQSIRKRKESTRKHVRLTLMVKVLFVGSAVDMVVAGCDFRLISSIGNDGGVGENTPLGDCCWDCGLLTF